jgi:hypothetical protein
LDGVVGHWTHYDRAQPPTMSPCSSGTLPSVLRDAG